MNSLGDTSILYICRPYNLNPMKIRTHLKETISLATPVVIGQVGITMMGVVDSAMVGRVGDAPLAASSISQGFFFIITVIGLGIVYAITPLVAIAIGSADNETPAKVFRQGFWVSLITSIVLGTMIYFGVDLIRQLDQPKEVTELAISYTRILAFSLPPMLVFACYKQFIEGLSFTRPAMVITLLANLVNFVFNWVLIYGNLGAPSLGLDGAGIATLGSRIFMFAALAYFVHRNREFKRFGLKILPFRGLDQYGKEILRIGIPSGFQYFFEVGCFSAAAFMVGWIGKDDLASHQIAMNVAATTYLVCLGVSTAGTIRVGNALGAFDIAEVKRAGASALALGVGFMIFSGIMLIVFREEIPFLYTSDKEVVDIAPKLLLIAAFFQIFDGTQAVALGILRGIKEVRIPTVITFIAYWIIGLPSALLFGFPLGLGTEGIWYGLSISLVASSLMLNGRFFLLTRKMAREGVTASA